MLRMVPSGWEPFGFAGMGVSWLPPGCDPTDPGAAADCEYGSVVPTTATNMLMRLSWMTRLQDVVTFTDPSTVSRHGLISISVPQTTYLVRLKYEHSTNPP